MAECNPKSASPKTHHIPLSGENYGVSSVRNRENSDHFAKHCADFSRWLWVNNDKHSKMLCNSVKYMAMPVAEHGQKLNSLITQHISLLCGVSNVKIRESSGHFTMHWTEFTQRSSVDNFTVRCRIVRSNTWWYHMQHCDDPVRT